MRNGNKKTYHKMISKTIPCLLVGGPKDGEKIDILVTTSELRFPVEEKYGAAAADSRFPLTASDPPSLYTVSIMTDNLFSPKLRHKFAIAYTKDVTKPLMQAIFGDD